MIAAIQTMETNIGKKEVMEVIDSLKREKEILIDKLKSVELTISTLDRIYIHKNTSTSDYEETSTSHLAEIVPFKKSKSRSEIPTSYDRDGPYAKKILYILNKEDEMATRDLVNYIIQQEPELDKKLVKLNVGKAAIRLADEGKVIRDKQGNQNFFRLK